MKKIIIITIILFGLMGSASAFYSDNALTNIWNARPDLQKAFPGDPENNKKLEDWAKKYGWKENSELYNYYPDKAIVDKLIEVKTNDRITSLEKQIMTLTATINQLQNSSGQPVVIIQQPDGIFRNCWINANGINDDGVGRGTVVCEVTSADWPKFDNGNFKNIKFLTK